MQRTRRAGTWYSSDATQSWQTAVSPARAWPWHFSRRTEASPSQWQWGPPISWGSDIPAAAPVVGTSPESMHRADWLVTEQIHAQWTWWWFCLCGIRFSFNPRSYRNLSLLTYWMFETTLRIFWSEFRFLLGTSFFTLRFLHPEAPEHQRSVSCSSAADSKTGSLSLSLTCPSTLLPVSLLSLSAVAVMKWLITLP